MPYLSTRFIFLFCMIKTCYSQFGNAGPKICPKYNKCAKDEEPVPKWPLKLTSTGCNGLTGNGISMSSFGKFDHDLYHGGCCDNWNACIQVCGTLRAQCDILFEKCLEDSCNGIVDEEKKKMCTGNIATKKLLLQFSDCSAYEQAQNAGCECVKKTGAQEKRRRLLTNFYKKYNPEEVNKVENLLSKADSGKKLASLLLKLVAKYPKSVKRVKDPKEAMMEELLKNQKASGSKPDSKATTTTEVSDEDDEDERIEL